jgi:hypothetical protein
MTFIGHIVEKHERISETGRALARDAFSIRGDPELKRARTFVRALFDVDSSTIS